MGAAGLGTAVETADVALMDDDLRKLPLWFAQFRSLANGSTRPIAGALIGNIDDTLLTVDTLTRMSRLEQAV